MLIPSLANSGPNIVARDIIAELGGEIEFEVFYFNRSTGIDIGAPRHRIRLRDTKFLTGFDIVHGHELRPDLYLHLHHRRLKSLGSHTVTTMHCYLETALQYNYGTIARRIVGPAWLRALRSRSRLVVLSENMAKYYAKHNIEDSRIEVIYNGKDRGIALEPLSADDRRKLSALKSRYTILGGVGRVNSVKGFNQVIDSLVDNPDCAFVLIGDGPEKQNLQEKAIQLGVADRYLPLGYRSNAESYYPWFDIYMMVSHHEGLPLVLIEAAMNSIPTVCSSLDSMREFFAPEEVAFFDLDDRGSLNKAIRIAATAGADLSKRMRLRYEAQYTRSQMARQYLSVYAKLSRGDNTRDSNQD